MIPSAVEQWLETHNYGGVASEQPVGGGCINRGAILKTTSGLSFFLKVNAVAPIDMFLREFEGLEALRQTQSITVPEPYCCGRDFLLVADLAPTARANDYWQVFGCQLALMHSHTSKQFGFNHDNYIGSTPQPNPWTADGYQFFAEQRLKVLARAARDRGILDLNDCQAVDKLAARLPELVPQQPASLIHGDLWSGNALTDSKGIPAIIDPAAHYGWAEAELAMTTLFGSFPSEFYTAYEDTGSLEPGYRSRFPIYNLYHLLNHLLLFGSGYFGQVKAVLRRFH